MSTLTTDGPDRLLAPLATIPACQRREGEVDWFPPVDILNDAEEYLFLVDLPATNAEDIQVFLEGDGLVISGQRPERCQSGKTSLRAERPHGDFERRFALPEDASRLEIRSVFEDGVLELHVPKARPVQPLEPTDEAAPRLRLRSSG